jgi:hypothetical protein
MTRTIRKSWLISQAARIFDNLYFINTLYNLYHDKVVDVAMT